MKGYELKYLFLLLVLLDLDCYEYILSGRKTEFLTAEEYMQAINDRSKLVNDISLLREQYTVNYNKFQ